MGAFMIWTHKLKGIEFIDQFRPLGCTQREEALPAVTIQAGEHWIGLSCPPILVS